MNEPALPPPADQFPREPAPPRGAAGHLASHLRLWLCAAVGLCLDLWSKDWAFKTLSWHESRQAIPDVLSFSLSLNPGALFGLGKGLAPIFVGASVLALMFVIYLFIHTTPRHRWTHMALGMVLAGALGNLYDRTMVQAYVWRDNDTGQHYVGKLVRDDRSAVVIGEYPSGKNPILRQITPSITAGPRPVVRDFIKFDLKIGERSLWPWVFNIADALLVVGVAILMLSFWFDGRAAERAARSA